MWCLDRADLIGRGTSPLLQVPGYTTGYIPKRVHLTLHNEIPGFGVGRPKGDIGHCTGPLARDSIRQHRFLLIGEKTYGVVHKRGVDAVRDILNPKHSIRRAATRERVRRDHDGRGEWPTIVPSAVRIRVLHAKRW